jgi:hypothetical protein
MRNDTSSVIFARDDLEKRFNTRAFEIKIKMEKAKQNKKPWWKSS